MNVHAEIQTRSSPLMSARRDGSRAVSRRHRDGGGPSAAR